MVGSFDPNDKNVSPKGAGLPGHIMPEDSVLKYTIRFQNTGNFTASFVAIKDTLDADLDITSIKPGAASHDYRMQIMDDRTLVFLFDPINLPDSTSNEPASHGMVSFYIKQQKNLTNGTEIRNRAAIYFDFNKPVITNGTLNTLQVVTSVKEISQGLSLNLLPNPTNGNADLIFTAKENFKGEITVTNLLGEEILKNNLSFSAGANRTPINLENMPNGVYLLRLKSENYSGALRLLKQ